MEVICSAEEAGSIGSLPEEVPACGCGGVLGVPNNVYGCGLINAGAAVEAALR